MDSEGHFHDAFLAYEDGDEFVKRFHLAAKGSPTPFILVIEGSIPDETNKSEGYWASFGTDEQTGQPARFEGSPIPRGSTALWKCAAAIHMRSTASA